MNQQDQQQAWNKEYQSSKGVPTSTRTTPSLAVKRLLAYIDEQEPEMGKRAIDLGCGIGRNALYLAERGYEVTAVDFAEKALEKFKEFIKNQPEAKHIKIQQVNLAKNLPFADNAFDLAIDIVTTMTLITDELLIFEKELRRIVSSGGLYLTYVLSNDDGYLEETSPGADSITIKESGITDNYLSDERLKTVYRSWEILVLDKIEKIDEFYGKNYTRRLWWLLLRNKKELI